MTHLTRPALSPPLSGAAREHQSIRVKRVRDSRIVAAASCARLRARNDVRIGAIIWLSSMPAPSSPAQPRCSRQAYPAGIVAYRGRQVNAKQDVMLVSSSEHYI